MTEASLEQVTQLADQLPADKQSQLVKHLLKNLRAARSNNQTAIAAATGQSDATASLYGAWKGKFPDDIDLDAELAEIRGEWLKELDELEQWEAEQQQ